MAACKFILAFDWILQPFPFSLSNGRPDNDYQAILAAVQEDIPPSQIRTLCEKYLDPRRFEDAVRLVSGLSYDALELYFDNHSVTIQEAITNHPDPDTIYLQQPAPSTLPIVMLRVSDDRSRYMIPSAQLQISRIISRSPPLYKLQAVVCELNQRSIVFFKNLRNDRWYFYQSHYPCEQLNANINETLNLIIESGSHIEQENQIRSAHFLISLIFFNATKYIYVKP